jgi:hypothetical protein
LRATSGSEIISILSPYLPTYIYTYLRLGDHLDTLAVDQLDARIHSPLLPRRHHHPPEDLARDRVRARVIGL